MHRKIVALGATLALAAGFAVVTQSHSAPVLGTSIMQAVGLGAAPAEAATTRAHSVKLVVKAGGACKKVGARATIKRVAYVCAKNTKTKKLVWVKKAVAKKVVKKKVAALSAECRNLQSNYVKMKSDYDKALAQIADTETKIAVITGPSGDALRAQVASLKSMILALAPTVSGALSQFKTFC